MRFRRLDHEGLAGCGNNRGRSVRGRRGIRGCCDDGLGVQVVIVNGFLDWATRIDGVADKIYSEPNRGIGIACHSVVGRESEFQDGVPNRFLSTEKTADGRYTASAAASSMFVLRESGELIQMYPVTASTWTSGGREGNTSFWAIEAEGGLYPNYGEQLTEAATEAFIRLVTEFEDHTGIPGIPDANILQHRQIAALYGYAPTACASGRYDTAWARVASGERYGEMTKAEIEAIVNERIDATVGLTLLALLEQMTGIAASTFSDTERVEAVLDALIEHEHLPSKVKR